MTDSDRHSDRHSRDTDPNPFVAFRRFADAQFASMFDQADHAASIVPQSFTDYKQAVNNAVAQARVIPSPEHAPARARPQLDTWGWDSKHDANGPAVDPSPEDIVERNRRPGLLGRTLGLLGKTSRAEEMERAEKLRARDATSRDALRAKQDAFNTASESRGLPKGECSWAAQTKGDKDDLAAYLAQLHTGRVQRNEIDEHPAQCYGIQDNETCASREKGDCQVEWAGDPHAQKATSSEGDENHKHHVHDTLFSSYAWAPWELGQNGKMQMVAVSSLPKALRDEIEAGVREAEKHAKQEHSMYTKPGDDQKDWQEKQNESIAQGSCPFPGDHGPMEVCGPYDPIKLCIDESTRGHAPWHKAFCDLMASANIEDDEACEPCAGERYNGICPFLREEAEEPCHATQQENDDDEVRYQGIQSLLKAEKERIVEQAEERIQRDEEVPAKVWTRLGGISDALWAMYCRSPYTDDNEEEGDDDQPNAFGYALHNVGQCIASANAAADKRAKQVDQDDDREERDLYDRHDAPTDSKSKTQPTYPLNALLAPGLVSSLTEVERELQPDGTMSTVRRTKMRFVDGRVERSEEYEEIPMSATGQELDARSVAQAADLMRWAMIGASLEQPGEHEQKDESDRKGGSGGWFW